MVELPGWKNKVLGCKNLGADKQKVRISSHPKNDCFSFAIETTKAITSKNGMDYRTYTTWFDVSKEELVNAINELIS